MYRHMGQIQNVPTSAVANEDNGEVVEMVEALKGEAIYKEMSS